ncbi:MAG: putative O-methyltransferase [Roseibaca calidilacus]|uniref:Putative O-methyltransferase n=1 Tax=Roseibaca calidilacus TaxID=1666912 RepID=A0A0P7YTR8_9RHOB|nr:methyltransferase [Roseibaca calidilacus]KPP92786.1 MAG: putative O-methyltransferase [Roseibaca calidilacus]CUX80142.1 tRNA1(Val) A37 N6-methylase TrmN6 [Roseibaca calidilacus]
MIESNDAGLTCDAFLGGHVQAWQPRVGYRAATDPVFLAASVPARAGQSVLELGCGVGVASLCLAARVPGLALDGVELQGAYAALARRNATTNRVALTVTEADLRDLPCDLRNRSFDHVIANPPYYAANGPAAQDAGRDRALREDTPLAEWLDVGLRRVRDGGYLTIIHLTERLPDILAGIAGRASAVVLPLAARAGHPARRAIVQARKGARSPFMLLPPLVIHQGDHHPGDGEYFTDAVRAIMRDLGALDLTAMARG